MKEETSVESARLLCDEQLAWSNASLIEADNSTNMARLLNQSSLLTQAAGRLFPEHVDMTTVKRVLDLGCGPGGWVLEVASHFPSIQITGVDLSSAMIDYAHAHAVARGYENAHFQVMDILQLFVLEDASFDLVHGRFLSSFL